MLPDWRNFLFFIIRLSPFNLPIRINEPKYLLLTINIMVKQWTLLRNCQQYLSRSISFKKRNSSKRTSQIRKAHKRYDFHQKTRDKIRFKSWKTAASMAERLEKSEMWKHSFSQGNKEESLSRWSSEKRVWYAKDSK